MKFTETPLKGAYLIDVNKIADERGFFGRSYCKEEWEAYGLNTGIVQNNVSFSLKKGTLRGMHMQAVPFAETKTIRCTKGSIYDVIIDMRPQSETYKQWYGVELIDGSYTMLYVPEGFAHGFITMEDDTHVSYQVTASYAPQAERGYRWDDPAFNIEWPIKPVVISAKDLAHPFLDQMAETLNKF